MDKKGKISGMFKDGVSVNEIESFARKYTSEVFLVLAIIIGCISSIFDFFTGAGWSIAFLGIGAIVSVLFPNQIEKFLRKMFHIISKNEKSTQIIVGIVRIVIAIFVPFILFGLIGLGAGTSFHIHTKQASEGNHESHHEDKHASGDDEHI